MKFSEIIKKGKEIRLKSEEKSAIRGRLYAVAREIEARSTKHEARSWVSMFFRPVPILASLIVALLLGGGVSFASENALPGDLLYPIKVSVNEEIRAKLALSAEAKAGWEAQRADRRLAEAEKLFDKGRLTSEQQEKVQIAFDKHAIAAQSRATAKVSEKIEKIARKHEQIIARITRQAESAEAASAVSLMADLSADTQATRVPKAVTKTLVQKERRPIQETTLESTVDIVMKAVEDKIATAQKNVSENKLNEAIHVIADGKQKADKKLYGEAIILFRKANRIIQEAQRQQKMNP